MKRSYVYAFGCTDEQLYDYKKMEKMKETETPISYDRARVLLGPQLADWAVEHNYARHGNAGQLTLRKDWHVAYFKGWFYDRPCVHIVWSAFDFVWLAPAEWRCAREGVWFKGDYTLELEFSDNRCQHCGQKLANRWVLRRDGKAVGRDFATLDQARIGADVFIGED